MVFETLLDPVFRPLLALPPFWAIFLISFVITLAITLVYKYATDQQRMRELKGKVKSYQEKMKQARDKPDKMMKLQQEAMSFNMELMKHSFKPTLYTFIPIIIIFGWLNAHMAFYNLAPAHPFALDATFQPGIGNATLTVIPEQGVTLLSNATQQVNATHASWQLEADAGTYKATVAAGSTTAEKTILVTDERRYEPPAQKYKDNAVTQVTLSNAAVKPLDGVSLLGWRPGWLGTYIILSVLISILLRKLLKVV